MQIGIYFLSELVDGAGAVGAEFGAGVLAVDVDADELSVELDDAVPDPFFVSAEVDDFELLLYRSAYQPPPLNETAGA